MATSVDISVCKLEAIKEQLEDRGWAVIDGVIPPADCDNYITQINTWKARFGAGFPSNIGSVIHKYNISHHEVPWRVRLQSKHVWAHIWGTDKLLSSTDGIAIGEPPELGRTHFDEPGTHTLHHDQGPHKKGLQAHQGAVYLEEALQDDWCFMVIEGSHKLHEEFFATHERNSHSEFRRLSDAEVQWYQDQGCVLKRLAVPKGGMVIWDSRTIHAGAPPKSDRANPGRWRYVVFVSMAPAIWASPEDMAQKRKSYNELRITRHWPAQGTSIFRRYRPHKLDIVQLPEFAKSAEVRLIAGDLDYDFGNGQSNGPNWVPLPPTQ